MSKDGWLLLLEESRATIESLRQQIASWSEIGERARDGLEKTHRNLWKSVEMIEESRRLLEMLKHLRQVNHGNAVRISRAGELVSSDLILAGQPVGNGSGKPPWIKLSQL